MTTTPINLVTLSHGSQILDTKFKVDLLEATGAVASTNKAVAYYIDVYCHFNPIMFHIITYYTRGA